MHTAAPDLVRVWPLLRVHLWLCSSHHRAKNRGPPVEVPSKGMEQPFPRLHSLTTKGSTHMHQQKASNQATLHSVHQVKDTCLRVSGSVIHNTLTVYESVKQVLLGRQGWKIINPTLLLRRLYLIEKSHWTYLWRTFYVRPKQEAEDSAQGNVWKCHFSICRCFVGHFWEYNDEVVNVVLLCLLFLIWVQVQDHRAPEKPTPLEPPASRLVSISHVGTVRKWLVTAVTAVVCAQQQPGFPEKPGYWVTPPESNFWEWLLKNVWFSPGWYCIDCTKLFLS